MKLTGGQIAVRALEDEGIPFTFGIPGTHNIELYDALAVSKRVRPILVTDEQSASFMADAVWRASGQVACVNVVPGAGLTHALSGIAEAFLDNVPMLVLGCGVRTDTGFAYQLHDVDQGCMVAPVVKAVLKPTTGSELYAMIRDACAFAREGSPGPVFVEVPANLYLEQHRFDGGRGSHRGASGGRSGAPAGGAHEEEIDPEALARVVDLIEAARRPLLYVGAGTAAARDKVLTLAERLEAPVSTTFQGKGVFPETHPLFLWPGFGDAAPPFVREVASSCDLTLAIGCRFSEVGTGSYGLEPPGPLVHVDIDPEVPGRNYPAEVGVVADAGAFLQALLGALPRSSADNEGGGSSGKSGPVSELRDTIASGHAEVWNRWQGQGGGGGVSPPHLLRTLQELMGPDTIFTADSGNGTFLAVECLRLDQPGKLLAPVDYSCMGYSVPAALGAKLARPDCPVVALAGDGAFLMTGLETLTGAREGLGVIVVVLRDRELAQIAQVQEVALNRKTQSVLPDFDLEALARGMGVPYSRMESDDEAEDVIKGAVVVAEQGTPVVVEVKIDYSEKTYFTRGVVKTNFLRLPMKERVRFIGRAVKRRFLRYPPTNARR